MGNPLLEQMPITYVPVSLLQLNIIFSNSSNKVISTNTLQLNTIKGFIYTVTIHSEPNVLYLGFGH